MTKDRNLRPITGPKKAQKIGPQIFYTPQKKLKGASKTRLVWIQMKLCAKIDLKNCRNFAWFCRKSMLLEFCRAMEPCTSFDEVNLGFQSNQIYSGGLHLLWWTSQRKLNLDWDALLGQIWKS